MNTIVTNEWMRASGAKMVNREVLVMMSDGFKMVGRWNGYYWVDQEGVRIVETVGRKVEWFYVFFGRGME